MLMAFDDVEVRHLRALRAVAEEGSFIGAADILGFSQAAISQQIAGLEKAIGQSVFDRPGGPRPVTLTPAQALNADPAVFLQRFEQDYTTLFGRPVAGMAVEITLWSVNAATLAAPVEDLANVAAQPSPAPLGQRALFDAALGTAHPAAIYDRAALPLGARVQGPALITEEETTTVLPLSRQARILGDGCIDITVQGV